MPAAPVVPPVPDASGLPSPAAPPLPAVPVEVAQLFDGDSAIETFAVVPAAEIITVPEPW